MGRRLAVAQLAELWARRAAGESGTRIARHMGLYGNSVREYIRKAGGVRPRLGTRSRRALSLQEREEISRGLAAGDSLRSIAARIGRSPSTVSREVARNQGRKSYRAGSAEQGALIRAKAAQAGEVGGWRRAAS
jgi:DNA-binding CsgD family transcriptional regulator